MGIFPSFFSRNKQALDSAAEGNQEAKVLPEIKQEDFVDHSDPNDNDVISIQYGTQMPIDIIYTYIDKDYEEQGYDDAMCNADCTYKDSKKLIIKNELKRLFERVGLRYKSDLRDIEVQISIVEQQGLMNTASSLKARKETFLEHMETMKMMEECLDNEEQQMLSMISSYERGFLKGLAAKSDSLLRNGNN